MRSLIVQLLRPRFVIQTQVASCLLVAAFVYDIFFVFVSPLIFHKVHGTVDSDTVPIH